MNLNRCKVEVIKSCILKKLLLNNCILQQEFHLPLEVYHQMHEICQSGVILQILFQIHVSYSIDDQIKIKSSISKATHMLLEMKLWLVKSKKVTNFSYVNNVQLLKHAC